MNSNGSNVTRELPRATAGPMLVLRGAGADGLRDLQLRDGGTIGRNPDCDVVVEDGLVSRRHATLRVRAGRWCIEDNGSRNGTWVNERRVTGPVELEQGDRVRVGTTSLDVLGGDLLQKRSSQEPPTSGARYVSFEMSGRQSGNIDMVGGDKYDYRVQRFEDQRREMNFYGDNSWLMILHSSGAARVFMILGMFVALAGVGSWGYPIVRAVTEGFSAPAGSFDPPDFQATPWLPMGAALALAGSVLIAIGMALSHHDRRRK